MTKERLEELNKLLCDYERVDEHRTRFDMHPQSMNRPAVIYLIGGGNYEPSVETWKKLRDILKEDIDLRHAEAKVNFGVA